MSRVDAFYRRLLLTKFFTKGWGKPEDILRIIALRKSIKDSTDCASLTPADYPIHIDKDVAKDDHRLVEGHFVSPFHHLLPDIMPPEVQTAKFQGIFPLEWSGDLKPVVVHLAGTGDHFFWRRRSLLALPMLKKFGMASIMLENPFYGYRKPKAQLRSSLHNVSDLFVMGGALILESAALFHWCERNGYGPLGITGISMGGYMASLAASNWNKPVSLIPCLSWTTASSVFTEGVMSHAIPWRLLQSQYRSNALYKHDVWPRIESPETELMEQVSTYYQHGPHLPADHRTNSVTPANAKRSQKGKIDPEIFTFMKTLLDEFTHLGNFPKPADTSLVIVVAAMKDAYVPVEGYVGLDKLWPGMEARYLNSGHISSFLFKQNAFKDAIRDGMMKQILKYHPESSEALNGLRGIEKPRKEKRWSPRKLIPTRASSSGP